MFRKIINYICYPNKILIRFVRLTTNFWNDKTYISILYFLCKGKLINLKTPKTYTEKLQWLKLNYQNPKYTSLVDKYEMKHYVENVIGREHIVPCYGIWDRFEDIDFDELPNQFVLKCTHDSGSFVICNDKNKLNINKIKKIINKGINRDYYKQWREWPYKNVRRRIIAEALLVDESSDSLTDYKFFCFHGEPQIMYISNDAGKNPTTDFFDMEFNNLDLRMRDPNSKQLPTKPACFDEMKSLARKLCKGMPHVRVDFYFVNGIIYVGELTFYHNSGLGRITPYKWELMLGNMLNIEACKKELYYISK